MDRPYTGFPCRQRALTAVHRTRAVIEATAPTSEEEDMLDFAFEAKQTPALDAFVVRTHAYQGR
jgi:hypothetical protein